METTYLVGETTTARSNQNQELSGMALVNRKISLALLALIVTCYWWAAASAIVSLDESCPYEIVESMPELLEFERNISFKPKPTHESLIDIINHTQKSLKIASFYVSLTADQERRNHPSAKPGLDLMAAIADAAARGVKVEVVLDGARTGMSTEEDVEKLEQLGDVKFLNMTKLINSGVMHSKFLISDQNSIYIGSSNFDWRSYSQIKEIGIVFYRCPTLATDLNKIFKTYQLMADTEQVPASLPAELSTTINIDHPVELKMDDQPVTLFMGSSPPIFNGDANWNGRTSDIDGLLHVINKANKRVDISVMNYNARTVFSWPKKYWPRIDEALRRAATERRVEVRLLFSNWSVGVKEEELMWYKSLNAIQSKSLRGGSIRVKLFKVPSFNEFQSNIPYARVKHDKYMVTEQSLYIGTSNWTPDYFINTCGVGLVIEPKSAYNTRHESNLRVINNMRELFERDFNSKFATDLA